MRQMIYVSFIVFVRLIWADDYDISKLVLVWWLHVVNLQRLIISKRSSIPCLRIVLVSLLCAD